MLDQDSTYSASSTSSFSLFSGGNGKEGPEPAVLFPVVAVVVVLVGMTVLVVVAAAEVEGVVTTVVVASGAHVGAVATNDVAVAVATTLLPGTTKTIHQSQGLRRTMEAATVDADDRLSGVVNVKAWRSLLLSCMFSSSERVCNRFWPLIPDGVIPVIIPSHSFLTVPCLLSFYLLPTLFLLVERHFISKKKVVATD